MGVESANAISMYERGKRKPDPETLLRFARLYDTTSDYLLGLTDDPRSLVNRIDDATMEDVELRVG